MSEVKRYDMCGFEGGLVECKDGAWYHMDDFDRVTAELDAALEEVEALKHWRDLALQFDNHRMRALWHLRTLVSDGAHYDAAATFLTEPPVPASELQQRLTESHKREDALQALLTAADERADVLEGLLRGQVEQIDLVISSLEFDEKLHRSNPERSTLDFPHAIRILNRVKTALKSSEGGGDVD